MKKLYLILTLLLALTIQSQAQDYSQYFDGADTSIYNSLFVYPDTAASNIWQIGVPQKIIFDSASTVPNAIVTDTINSYPVNNESSFVVKLPVDFWWAFMALQWRQKLDLEDHHDAGYVYFSMDHGLTWENALESPYVYNQYGYDPANLDTFPTNGIAFSGIDSSWRDVWLCLNMPSLGMTDTLYYKFTFASDSSDSHQEGWMLDNFIGHITIMHPVKEIMKPDHINVYPNPAKDIVNIEIQKSKDFRVIQKMEFTDQKGSILRSWQDVTPPFSFDVTKYAEGMYFLTITTNLKSELHPVIIKKY